MSFSSIAAGAWRLFLFAGLVLLVACSTPEPPEGALAPVQSPNDRFAYRLVELDNGLKALLISNPDSPKAAASLDVHVGSGDNPPGRGGLAHFLEHMLFLGTEKYPDAAEYERYVTEYGGSRNAYTSFEHTNYFFDIDPDQLSGALDRFAQFFVAPTFDARYVERERNAVEAEYQMGLKSDPRRELDVVQATMNPEHPFSQFSVGSLETLADRPEGSVRDDLIRFYEKHYSADIMRLVVLGRESLDELEGLVEDSFAAVPNRRVELSDIDEPLFVDAQLPMLLRIQPEGTRRQLEVNFQIPDFRSAYRAKPMAYVSNLVGHEGEGSLLSLLKREGLAEGLSSGTGLEWRGGALFSITVALTERGVENYERVLQGVFAYLDLLRQRGPQRRIYAEQGALAELAFRFREPSAPISYVSSLSNRMHYYSDEDILQGPYLMQDFDAEAIDDALQMLIPAKAQVVLTAPDLPVDRRSPYYEVSYAALGPEALMISQWEATDAEGLHLPAPNPFIAENVELLAIGQDSPKLPVLVETDRKRIWYKQATEFRVPKGAAYVSFRSPLVASSAGQRAATALYTRMVSDALNEYTYPALLAGLGFNFYSHAQGIGMRVSGYNDKQLLLLEELLASIAAQRFDEQRFERLRRDMILDLQNTVARRPSSQLIDDLRRAIGSGQYDESELIAELEALTPASLQAFREAFWTSARVEAMLYGNYPPAAVSRVGELMDVVLRGEAGEPAAAPSVLRVAADDKLQLQATIDHNDAVVAWYLQGAGQTWRDRAMVALSAQVVQSGFFQQLRTEQQLGYIVSSFAWPQYDVPGLMLLVQSPSHSTRDVHDAMREFLSNTRKEITAEQFERHREALIKDLLKPHENLGERAEFYWQAIASRDWEFDAPRRLADAVGDISFAQWQSTFTALFIEHPRSLLAFSTGAAEVAPDDSGTERFATPEALSEGRPRYTIDLAPL